MSHIHTEVEDGKQVQYLRFDIAKEREAKLILAAYHSCVSLAEVRDFDEGAALLYKKARIQKLK